MKLSLVTGAMVRARLREQQPDRAQSQWVRLNLPGGPVLARTNTAHRDAPIYLAKVMGPGHTGYSVKHYFVDKARYLRGNGISGLSEEVREAWTRLIGLTEHEYGVASIALQALAESVLLGLHGDRVTAELESLDIETKMSKFREGCTDL